MKKTHGSKTIHVPTGKHNLFRRLCSMVLILSILLSVVPASLAEMSAEPYLSLYYVDATMEEGKSSQYPDEFFANIAAIAMMDISNQDFFMQLADAVDSGYKCRIYVMHEKGMPATDLAILYCFQNSSWFLKDLSTPRNSIYLNVSWEILQGLNFKMQQQELTRNIPVVIDDIYECNPEYVWQTFMEFVLFIEERNKTVEQFLSSTTEQIPELPKEIDSWPITLPISVQLPKELTVLDALFTVELATSAATYFSDIPESQRFEGTVNDDNLITGTLQFWEAGPHLVRLVFTASINGHNQSLSHNISIDTSNVQVAACPVYETGHQWKYEWQEEHPHYGHYICDCGATKEDPNSETREDPDCCECVGHEWTLSYFIWEGKGSAIGKCRRCGIGKDMTDEMPDYIRSYLNLIAETGAEGNTYYDDHSTGNTFHLRDTAPWVYIADQSLTRLTNAGTIFKESYMDALADPFIFIYQTASGENEEKLNIYSKAQLLWIELIQDMMKDNEQNLAEELTKSRLDTADNITEVMDYFTDYLDITNDADTAWLKALADEAFAQKLADFEQTLKSAQTTLENVKSTTTDPAKIIMEQDKVDQAINNLNAFKEKGPDYSLVKNPDAETILYVVPYVLNAISSVLEGMEAGEKVDEMRSAYISMLNDYSRSHNILDTMKKDAIASNNKSLEAAIDTIIQVLDATYQTNVGQYFDATTKIMNSLEEEMKTSYDATKETFAISFIKKDVQTAVMQIVSKVFKGGINPLTIASLAAKVTKSISNYDEIFDASTELAALSSMRQDASISLHEVENQISPYTLALYAELESEGCEKAADFVSTLSSDEDIDKIMREIIKYSSINYNPAIALILNIADLMDVKVKDFGIGNNEKQTVVNMLQKEKTAYDDYVRQNLKNAGN